MARQIFGKGRFKKGTMAQVAEHLTQKVADHVRTKCFDIFADTIRATPVDTGRLRNNWNTSLNSINLSSTTGKGSSKIGEAKKMTEAFELGDSIFFANNLPYAMKIELGSSKQAPQGMLRTSIRNHV